MSKTRSNKITVVALMQRALEVPGILSLAAGFTDNDLLPCAEVRSIVANILVDPQVLQYSNPPGRQGLRSAICNDIMASDRACGADPGLLEASEVVVTNGSQQALYIMIQALCQPGDVVLVESPTYFVFLDLLDVLGIRAIGMPAKDDRLDLDRLGDFFNDLRSKGMLEKVRAVYAVSYFSNPSGLSLEREQKVGLVRMMQSYDLRVPILEDIAYREMYFDKPWPAPTLLEAYSANTPLVLTGTFTKNFSTGLKVGYLWARDAKLRERVLDIKRAMDFGTSNFSQAIIEHAISEGIYARFLERMRAVYDHKCEVLHDALIRHGLHELGWRWERSCGGLYLWLTAPKGVETTADSKFFDVCIEEKILYVPGDLCFVTGGENKVRLSFGYLEEESLPEGAERFVRAAARLATAR